MALPPRSRPHQVELTSFSKESIRYRIIELETGEVRATGLLASGRDVRVNVKGPTRLEANGIEYLRVKIDGVPFRFPPQAKGIVPVDLGDPATAPPPLPVGSPSPKKKR